VLELSTQDDLAESMLKFTTLRKQRNRAGGGGGKLAAQLHTAPTPASAASTAPGA
jgi:hypothetical protein